MTAVRRRWLLGTAAVLIVLLFAGQWLAEFLAERWWAGDVVPEAAGFVSGIRLLRLTLDAAAVLIATAWYSGHLLLVHRAIGSVQISRQMANLEIREAVTPATLLPLAIGSGVALGLIAGLGSGGDWPIFALAWQGVSYGVADPLLHKDLGVFVGQLPLWIILHAFARLLVWSALIIAAALYAALGALRWQGGRLAISGHARRHLGFLLGAGALVLTWGFVLSPFELVATAAPGAGEWGTRESATMALAGAALAAAVISALWALRGHHFLMVAGWGVLLAGTAFVWLMLPAVNVPVVNGPAGADPIGRLAYGLEGLEERSAGFAGPAEPGPPSLWTSGSIGRLVSADSQVLESAAQTTLTVNGTVTPVWLAMRSSPAGPNALLAIADSRIGPHAAPMSFRDGDSLPYPGLVTFRTLPPNVLRPGAPRLVVDSGGAGLIVGGTWRRIVLSWALQSARLLGASGASARVRWHLVPRDRLEALAPFASWESPRLFVVGATPMWVGYGYLASAYFPGSARVGGSGALEAGLVGAIDAVTGATTIYLLSDAGALTRSWAAIAHGVVRPAGELPHDLRQALPYPARLFDAQAAVLEAGPWQAGVLAGRPALLPGDPLPPAAVWTTGNSLTLVAAYERGEDHRVESLLLGRVTESGRRLDLIRLGKQGSLPGAAAAQSTWDRFPSSEQLRDSIVRHGARFERGPYRVLPMGDAPIAYQPWYAFEDGGQVTQPYVTLAQGVRAGAGRSFGEAWANLNGSGAPLPPGFGPTTPLEEARRWMLRADSALHAGDWEGFGRAFEALRQTLGAGPKPP